MKCFNISEPVYYVATDFSFFEFLKKKSMYAQKNLSQRLHARKFTKRRGRLIEKGLFAFLSSEAGRSLNGVSSWTCNFRKRG